MDKTQWNKLVARELTDEEKEFFGDEVTGIWEGVAPEIDEEVLVYTPESGVTTDTWIEYEDGVGFENFGEEEEVIFWTSFPEPPNE